MKILFLTNNDISASLVSWLRETLHEEVEVFPGKLSYDAFQSIKPDWVVSYNYRHIIKEDVLNILPGKFINLHISYLPWNRGAQPNVWSILEGTPSGVTIHLIDKGLDTGNILIQKEVPFDQELDTLESSYLKLNYELQSLFKLYWAQIITEALPPQKQPVVGTFHFSNDFEGIKFLLGEEGWSITIKELVKRYRDYLAVKNNGGCCEDRG